MVKFSDFILENSTELASKEVSDNEKLYNIAMKTNNSKDLKVAMLKMKTKFKNYTNINFNKIDWEEIFVDLNEKVKK